MNAFYMRSIIIVLVLININSFSQTQHKVSSKGWLIYQQDYLLAFFPIKDQTKTPTYDNFLTEDKSGGERMNGNSSASTPLLIAKKIKLSIYDLNVEAGKEMKQIKQDFYIQPVKYEYNVSDITGDTCNQDYL